MHTNNLKRQVRLATMGLLALTAGNTTLAHHSVAAFDMQKTITIQGTVEKLEWTNPHMWLWVIVTDKDGKAESWALEAASPANMQRRAGWTKRSVTAGEKVQVDVHPFRDGRAGGSLTKVVKADGSVLGSGGGNGNATRTAED
ncbi:MAG: DUF6152 family protein [Steroidobacteraceae bacterium]